MSVSSYAQEHGAREIVHFTTNKGLLGMMFTKCVFPRSELRPDQIKILEFIYQLNAASRLDKAWFGYVNLSINEINRRYFERSGMWHQDLWWVILSFDPSITDAPNTHFTNTNNGWKSGVVRTPGLAGIKMVYEEHVDHGTGWGRHTATTTSPTCPQAEVLYPGPLSLDHLQRVYVRDRDNYREASSYLTFLGGDIPVELDAERFKPHSIDPCK